MVSNLGLMGFDEKTKQMMLLATHPGVKVEQVIENTEFEMLVADKVTENKPPTDEELKKLREQVDPDKLYI